MLLPISRRGDALSESEVYELLTREPGEPSERLESAPSANRDEPLRSTEAFGGVGIGEEPPESYVGTGIPVENIGGGLAGFAGELWRGSGVFWNSARVPFSVSSLQRTPRLALDGDFFLAGEN